MLRLEPAARERDSPELLNPERPKDRPFQSVAPYAVVALGVYLVILGTLLGSLLIGLWPLLEEISSAAAPAAQGPGASAGDLRGSLEAGVTAQGQAGRDGISPPRHLMQWLWADFSLTSEGALLLLVMGFGALGAYVHTVTSFVDYVGNRRLAMSWMWWYLLRPLVGTALALIFYVAIRGGFFAQEAQTADVNPFGMAALAGLAGLFSKQATDKLREVFDTLFRTAKGAGDEQRLDPLANPIPSILLLEPQTAKAGKEALRITIRGQGFVSGSTVLVNHSPVPTAYVGPNEVRMELPAELRSASGTLQIKVRNPEPGGGASEPATLELMSGSGAQRRP